MRDGGYLDVEGRPAKAPGGQSEPFPTQATPYVFANFNGTRGDIAVHVHEMGHALQLYTSFGKRCVDAEHPSAETAEIHSMALELLASHEAHLLVGPEAAERFRRLQLVQFLRSLARLALGYHFQHEIYAQPGLTPAERHAVWHDLERRYTPWQDWGDLTHSATGAAWHAVLHVFQLPFYFIDYALAACCALQLWSRARHDRSAALVDYFALCRCGSKAAFDELIRSMDLASPFEPGSLANVIAEVEQALAA